MFSSFHLQVAWSVSVSQDFLLAMVQNKVVDPTKLVDKRQTDEDLSGKQQQKCTKMLKQTTEERFCSKEMILLLTVTFAERTKSFKEPRSCVSPVSLWHSHFTSPVFSSFFFSFWPEAPVQGCIRSSVGSNALWMFSTLRQMFSPRSTDNIYRLISLWTFDLQH